MGKERGRRERRDATREMNDNHFSLRASSITSRPSSRCASRLASRGRCFGMRFIFGVSVRTPAWRPPSPSLASPPPSLFTIFSVTASCSPLLRHSTIYFSHRPVPLLLASCGQLQFPNEGRLFMSVPTICKAFLPCKIQSSLRFVFLVLVGGGGRGGCRFVGNPFRGHSGTDEEEMTALISVGSMVAPRHAIGHG